MNYKILTKIIIKLIALVFFMNYLVITISSAISLIEAMGQPGYNNIGILATFTPMALMVLLGVLIWIFADKIADKLVGEMKGQEIGQSIDYYKIQCIAFSFAGVLVICSSLPELFSTIYQINTLPDQPINIPERIYNDYQAKLIGSGIKTILGIWLLLGTKGIVNAIRKLRTAGIHEEV